MKQPISGRSALLATRPLIGYAIAVPEVTYMRNARFMAAAGAASFLLSAVALADVDPKIGRLWKAQCAACHGQPGKGDTDKGKQMKVKDMSAADFQAKKDDELKAGITNGVKWEGGDMPAFKDLTPDQVTGLVGLIRTFKK